MAHTQRAGSFNMSLVVSRVIDDEIRIISDTKFTDSGALHPTLLDGGLKCIAISHACCVCFAGNVTVAEEALAPILNRTIQDRQQITTHLLQHHKAARGDPETETDFIVASAGTCVAIDRIAEDRVETNIKAAWIGDHSAFSAYQSQYHAPDRVSIAVDERFRIADKMSDAFKSVIRDHQNPSVGDFEVTVTSKPAEADGFRYLSHLGAFGFQSVALTTTPTNILRSVGVEGGSFSYTVLVPKVAGVGALAVHLREGKVGAFFYPAHCWSPTVFKNVGVDEFVEAIAQRFGVYVDGFRH
jgi:hypothetical protein